MERQGQQLLPERCFEAINVHQHPGIEHCGFSMRPHRGRAFRRFGGIAEQGLEIAGSFRMVRKARVIADRFHPLPKLLEDRCVKCRAPSGRDRSVHRFKR